MPKTAGGVGAAYDATVAITVRVYPSPNLLPTEYLPGIGADGADLPADEAEDLIARGLAVREPATDEE